MLTRLVPHKKTRVCRNAEIRKAEFSQMHLPPTLQN